MAILPPWFILSIMSWKALGTRTSPAPSNPFGHAGSSRDIGELLLGHVDGTVAPILRAIPAGIR